MRADLRLYALIDPARAGGRDLGWLAREIVAGGATLLQLRDKHGSTRQLIEEARAIKAVLQSSGTPLLVNDRVDVALAAGADGVHVGWDDVDPTEARRLLGPQAIIGLSIKTPAQVEAAPLGTLDYVCVGGVFATNSKENPDPPIGIGGFKRLAADLRARAENLPVGAIAGIDATNAAEVVAAGADGVAVISALSLVHDPQAAAQELRRIIDVALSRRALA
ncbi:MAG: thiamine phosphate synthase [Xanthobacteraceae bacterium]